MTERRDTLTPEERSRRYTQEQVNELISRERQDQETRATISDMEGRMAGLERLVLKLDQSDLLHRIEAKLEAAISDHGTRLTELEKREREGRIAFNLDAWGKAERDALLPMSQWWVQRGRRMPFLTSNLTILSLVFGTIASVSLIVYNYVTTVHHVP